MKKGVAKKPPKRVAWGYLLPIGTLGGLNIGTRNIAPEAPRPRKGARKTRRAMAGGGGGGGGGEEGDDDEERGLLSGEEEEVAVVQDAAGFVSQHKNSGLRELLADSLIAFQPSPAFVRHHAAYDAIIPSQCLCFVCYSLSMRIHPFSSLTFSLVYWLFLFLS